MKAKERHHLKENDFATNLRRATDAFETNRRNILMGVGMFALVVVIGSAYFYSRRHTANAAGEMLGVAMAIEQSPIAPPSTLPGAKQQPGTYPTEKAKNEAMLAAYQQVATAYPSTAAGQAASYHAAGTLLAMGRFDEAQTAFKAVAASAGTSLYGTMAQMGAAQALAGAGKHDEAIKALTDLAAQRDSALPVDGVLMQLAQACLKAGKVQDARAAFKRVVDEFPTSGYVADARQQIAALN
jgi:tetratricopeptide (TPR) repeat protein